MTPIRHVFTCAALLLAACAHTQAPGLAGSQWQLVAIASMDDARGTTRVEDPTLYTLAFGSDGRAVLRLNCNRAQGSWESSPAGDGVSGTLRFGAMAGTRALCPPPSLNEKVLRDLGFVRSYLLRDGQLHLSLQADGGIYSWRPAPR